MRTLREQADENPVATQVELHGRYLALSKKKKSHIVSIFFTCEYQVKVIRRSRNRNTHEY